MQKNLANILKKDDPSKISNLNLEEDKIFSSYIRSKKLKDSVHYGFLAIIGMAFLIILASMFSLSSHLVLAEDKHWLSQDQIKELKNIFLSGSVAGNLIFFIRYYFLNDDTKNGD